MRCVLGVLYIMCLRCIAIELCITYILMKAHKFISKNDLFECIVPKCTGVNGAKHDFFSYRFTELSSYCTVIVNCETLVPASSTL